MKPSWIIESCPHWEKWSVDPIIFMEVISSRPDPRPKTRSPRPLSSGWDAL